MHAHTACTGLFSSSCHTLHCHAMPDYQQSFLAFFLCCVAKLLIRHVHGHAAYYVIACNCTCTFLWLFQMSTLASARFAQHHHTALGWIACKHAQGFAQQCFINPRRIRVLHNSASLTLGACARVTVVMSVCVCVSVTTLAAMYLVYTLKIRCR